MSRGKKTSKVRRISPHIALVFGLLFGLTLAAYWNSFDVPLVFDDLLTIQRNTGVRFGEFNWNLLSARSILYLTFTANYVWSGQDVWSYHLFNFVFHFLNGAMVFLIGLCIFRRIELDEKRCRAYALFAGAFFLVHPVQTESVTYISSRSELLSTSFYLCGLLLFVKWPENRIGFLFSFLVAVPFLFGLGSKETVISLPATIFLYDFLFLSGGQFRPMIRRWSFYLPFMVGAAAAVYYIVTVALKGSIGSGLPGHLSSWSYFLTQLRVIGRYIYLVFFPVGLNLDYGFPPSTNLLEFGVIAAALFHMAVLAWGWRLRKRFPVFSFSIFWFYLTLAPTSSVMPILDVIFEHRLYLPLIGVSLSFPMTLDLLQRNLQRMVDVRASVPVYAGVLLALLTVGTVMRNHVWGDEVRLWEDVVSKSPHKERSYNALAWAHFKRAEYNQAIQVLEKGRELVPSKGLDFSEMLGNLYLRTGRFDDAIELFTQQRFEFKEKRRLALSYNNLGMAYLYKWNALQARKAQMSEQGFVFEREVVLAPAAEAFAKALEHEPDMPWALDSYTNVSFYRGKYMEIEVQALERIKLKDDYNSLYILGKLAFLRDDFAAADVFFERAEKLRTDVNVLYFNHGYALNRLGQYERAIAKYTQAIRLDPIFIEAHHNVGLIYMGQRAYAQAVPYFGEVLRQDPNHISSNLNLAKIYIAQGNRMLARNHLFTVLKASPGHEEASELVRQLGP